MKLDYQSMERWNPHKRHIERYERGEDEQKVQDITHELLAKSRSTRTGFTFN